MVNGNKVDRIYELEDDLITLNQKLITLHRLVEDVKETVEIDIELEYREAKAANNADKISELSNEKLRKHAAKVRLNGLEVQLPTYDESADETFISYQDLVSLVDEAELDKLRLLRDIGFEKREFSREFSRVGMQSLTESL